MKRLLQCLFILALFAPAANAQERTITGTVTSKDDNGPIPGVTIRFKGAAGGTQTGSNGKFSVKVPSTVSVLEFSSIGYIEQSRTISSSNIINVIMLSDSKTLSDVVVIGYGTVKRKEVTGSVGSVSGAVLADRPVASFDQALAGRVTGVQVTSSSGVLGSAPKIRIRGTNSISNGSDPLYVIDGVPIITGNQSSFTTGNNPLGDINPNDIQSVDVLKDGAATAIYGSRASGGVIIVTTKKGVIGAPKVNYNAWFGSASPAKKFDLLKAADFVTIANEKLTNASALVSAGRAAGTSVNTDWQDLVFNKNAFQQNHALSVSGATPQSNYYVSLGYSDMKGIIRTNKQTKYQVLGKVEQKAFNNRLTLGVSSNVSYIRNFGLNVGTNALSGNIANAIRALPNVTPYNADSTPNFSSDGSRLGGQTNGRDIDDNYTNIDYVLAHNIYRNQNVTLQGNAFANVNILPGLDVKTQLSTNALFGEDYLYWNPIHGDGRSQGGLEQQYYIPSFRYIWTNTLNYTKTMGDHSISAVIGQEYQKSRYRFFFAQGGGLSNVFFGGQNIISSSLTQSTYSIGGGVTEQAYQSYFIRGNYSFQDKYLLSATYRSDKISSLPFGNQMAKLPGASIGWRISKEDFFMGSSVLRFINDLKLRGGYAKVGNTDIGSYPYAGIFAASIYGTQSGVRYNQVGNPDLSFETSKKINAGLDISFLQSRINLTADYFKNDVDNLILFAPVAPSLGAPLNGIYTNIGKMTNKGFEFSLNTQNIKKDDFSWSTDINLTLVKNKVTQLANNNTDVTYPYNILRVGESVGSLYGYEAAGVNPANGNPLYVKANGQLIQGNIATQTYFNYDPANPTALTTANTLAASDRKILGNASPTYFGGFNNSVTYKGFDFNIYLVFSGGNKIMNVTKQEGLLNQKFLNNGTEILNRWTTAGQVTDIPKLWYGRDAFTMQTSSAVSRYVEDGKFIRGQNIVLGYSLPKAMLSKASLTKLRIYAEVQNAFLITKYSGLDPELIQAFAPTTQSNTQSNTQAGVDFNTNPLPRTFVLGINVGF
ncbi:TonB-dependent receptor [Pedobacter sp. MC2016-15]|uniref:SusC/RagA family TonB-linked outer membrane protein n=1 Tax=Pedobacter sp. MC2016-15 TaxID=2994473 RepID=UPI0022479EF9|nr:TonB-dependent receptor [Pedobacter sp. MC2016-15]MCX2478560.1 TonB-dependent receptor [Pedobacter sp. MC2016-15]